MNTVLSRILPIPVGKRRLWPWALAAMICLGAGLRLVWIEDIEYKADEAWTFAQTQAVGRTAPFPWLGMTSSTGLPNPGMSVWVFLLLGRALDVQEPTELARAVQVLDIAALVLVVWVAFRRRLKADREPWLWAAALASVSPLAVLFQRKVWPPSVLPVGTLLLLLCWWHRERRWGAFGWGVLGACLGQIHMSGFFFAGGFVGWALLFDRRRPNWLSWLAGSALGLVPLIPWFACLARGPGVHGTGTIRWSHALECKFWTHWATEPLGLGLKYFLGADFGDFLGYPLIDGQPTYLVGALHGLVAAVGILLLVRVSSRLWRQRGRWRALWTGKGSATTVTQNAALWGFGLLLTLPGVAFNRHYLIVAFPLPFVWVARLALAPNDPPADRRWGRGLLAVLCLAQLLLSIHVLGYVHVNRRTIRGHYGLPYHAQARARTLSSATP